MQMQMCNSMDGRSVARRLVGWRVVCCIQVSDTHLCCLLFSLSPLLLSPFPSTRAVLLFVYRNEPSAAAAVPFYDRLARTESSGVGLQPLQRKPDAAD